MISDRKNYFTDLIGWFILYQLFIVGIPYLVKYNISQTKYSAASVVFLTEVCKFIICVFCELGSIFSEVKDVKETWKQFLVGFKNVKSILSTILPANLYTIQNSLTNKCLNLIPIHVFTLTYQMRIPATGLFNNILLGKILQFEHWMWFLLLTAGVILANVEFDFSETTPLSSYDMTFALGILLAVCAAMLSGFSSVLLEAVSKDAFNHKSKQPSPVLFWFDKFKNKTDVSQNNNLVHNIEKKSETNINDSHLINRKEVTSLSQESSSQTPLIVDTEAVPSLHIRNAHMAITASLVSCLLMFIREPHFLSQPSCMFDGYIFTVFLSAVLQALTGVVVSIVVQKTDNIVKCFLSAISVVLTVIIDYFLEGHISVATCLGCIIVLVATVGYNLYTTPLQYQPIYISHKTNKLNKKIQ